MRPGEWCLRWVTDGLRRVALGGGTAVAGGTLLAVTVFVFGIDADPACGCPPGPAFGAETVTVDGAMGVTVTYESGDVLRAGRLSVIVGDRRASWGERAGLSPNASVAVGDAITVASVEPGTTVRLVYRLNRGGRITLAEHTVAADRSKTAVVAAYG